MARVKSKRIETSICSIINIKLSKPIFGRPMEYLYKYQTELFQTLHEYSYLLRAQHIHIVCLQHGWFWNKNI